MEVDDEPAAVLLAEDRRMGATLSLFLGGLPAKGGEVPAWHHKRHGLRHDTLQ